MPRAGSRSQPEAMDVVEDRSPSPAMSSGSQSPSRRASSTQPAGEATGASDETMASSPAPQPQSTTQASSSRRPAMSESSFGSDDEDEVMQSIPIYLSHKLAPNLHLFQYPVTDRIQVPEAVEPKGVKIQARWKPTARRFELELPLDDRPDVYDEERGEEFAEGARLQVEKETPAPTGSSAAERRKLEKKKEREEADRRRQGIEGAGGPKKKLGAYKLRSEIVPDQTTYMAGSIENGGLYLHPVNLQLQLRPNLDYLDALDEKNREEKRRDRAGGEDSDEEAEAAAPGAPPKKEEGKAVSVAHKKTEGESKYGALSSSSALRQEFLARMQTEAEEPWVKLSWTDMSSDKAQNVLDGLYDAPTEQLECTTRPLDFLNDASIGA